MVADVQGCTSPIYYLPAEKQSLPLPPELWKFIFSFSDCPKTLNLITLTCRKFSELLLPELNRIHNNVMKLEKCFQFHTGAKKKRVTARVDLPLYVRLFSEILNTEEKMLRTMITTTEMKPVFIKNDSIGHALTDLLPSFKDVDLAVEIIKNNLDLFIEIKFFPERNNGDDSHYHKLQSLIEKSSHKKECEQLVKKKFRTVQWKYVAFLIGIIAMVSIIPGSVSYFYPASRPYNLLVELTCILVSLNYLFFIDRGLSRNNSYYPSLVVRV